MSKLLSTPVIYRGSVKDVRAEDKEKGPYYFEFSDRYSIFDWGEMPDQLFQKGQALAYMSYFFFRKMNDAKVWAHFSIPDFLPQDLQNRLEKSAAFYDLKKRGLPHHALGLVDENLETIGGDKKSHILKVKKVPVLRPEVKGNVFDYQIYQTHPQEALVPLEVIFRLGLPAGSSLISRLKNNPQYTQEIGVQSNPQIGQMLERPVVEFSTKLEPTDRYLSYAEAKKLAGLSEQEFDYLYDLTLLCVLKLKDIFNEIGVELWDGKFEFAFCPNASSGNQSRGFQLVDSIGPDELRLLFKGTQLSKEVLRTAYRNSSWYQATNKAKELAKSEGILDWKKICTQRLGQSPEKLSPEIRQWCQSIYTTLANELAQKNGERPWFKAAPSLNEVMEKVKTLLEEGV